MSDDDIARARIHPAIGVARLRDKGVDRRSPVGDPGRRTLRAGSGQRVEFTGGAFRGIPVPLGRTHTDEHGRLVVLGGAGRRGAADHEEPRLFGEDAANGAGHPAGHPAGHSGGHSGGHP